MEFSGEQLEVIELVGPEKVDYEKRSDNRETYSNRSKEYLVEGLRALFSSVNIYISIGSEK